MLVTIAVTQFECTNDMTENMRRAERVVRNAAARGSNVIVLQELFATTYFCQDQKRRHFALAEPLDDSRVVDFFSALARELGVVLPIPFFEKDGVKYYNSVAVVDADGSILGVYRKTHIPQGACYNEKFYFTPGKEDYAVFDTKFGKMGVLICWDQFFPEPARCLALQGADFIVYPTAIGTEPEFPNGETYLHWVRVIQGHAAANGIPIAVANRIGCEKNITFFGGSFIADHTGHIMTQIGGDVQKNGGADPDPVQLKGYAGHAFDFEDNAHFRAAWGMFRDRRPELYYEMVA